MIGAGTGGAREVKRGPLEEAIRALNEAFAAEGIDVRDDQVAGVVTPVAHDLATDEQLRQQATANTRDQFLESPTLRDRALGALWSNQETAARMHEVLQAGGDTQSHFVEVLGRYVFEAVRVAAAGGPNSGVGPVDAAQGGDGV